MAVFIGLKSIDFGEPATATFVFATDGAETARFSRPLADVAGTDARIAATAAALADELRTMAGTAERYAAGVAAGTHAP